MNLWERFQLLTLWNKVGAIGSIASVIGILLYFIPSQSSKNGDSSSQTQSQHIIVQNYPKVSNIPKNSPIFGIEKPFVHPSIPIVILAKNKVSEHKEPLDIKWDRLVFNQAGIPDPNPSIFKWNFSLKDNPMPKELMDTGYHTISVKFGKKPFSEEMTVALSNRAPIVQGLITPDEKRTDSVNLKINAATELQDPREIIKVDVFFNYKGQAIQIPLPVVRNVDENGVIHFSFETPIYGLPRLSADDPIYEKTFFGIRVTDPSGNKFYQEISYAKFMAPGAYYFGVNRTTDIRISRIKEEKKGLSKLRVIVSPPTPQKDYINGKPAIELKVTAHGEDFNQLEWLSNVFPDTEKQISLVFRGNNTLGIVIGNAYKDIPPPEERNIKYRIEQAKDGVTYTSNESIAKSLASPTTKKPLTPISKKTPSIIPKLPAHISSIISKPVRQLIFSDSFTESNFVESQSVTNFGFILKGALNGDADIDKDGYLTGTELGNYLQANVVEYTNDWRNPQSVKIKNPSMNRGDFVVNKVGIFKESHALVIGTAKNLAGTDFSAAPEEMKGIVNSLNKKGFKVELYLNLTFEQMLWAHRNFIDLYGSESNNRLLFYFSGNGYTLPKNNTSREGVGQSDATDSFTNEPNLKRAEFIMKNIMTSARRIKAKHVLLIFDSPLSGSIIQDR